MKKKKQYFERGIGKVVWRKQFNRDILYIMTRQQTNGQPGKGIWLNNKYKNQIENNNNRKHF